MNDRPAVEPAHPVDLYVGARLRIRRKMMGLSQTQVADALGITFQQIQKYERGANRIGASRLFDLSRVLDVPVSFFFDDMPAEAAAARIDDDEDGTGTEERSTGGYEPDPMAKRETLELVRAYYKINDPSVRKRLFELTKAVANAAVAEAAE